MTLSHNERMRRKLAKQLSDSQFTVFNELITKERKKEIRDMYGPKFKTPKYPRDNTDTAKFVDSFGDLIEEQTKVVHPIMKPKKVIKPLEPIQQPIIKKEIQPHPLGHDDFEPLYQSDLSEYNEFGDIFDEHFEPKPIPQDFLSKLRRRLK